VSTLEYFDDRKKVHPDQNKTFNAPQQIWRYVAKKQLVFRLNENRKQKQQQQQQQH